MLNLSVRKGRLDGTRLLNVFLGIVGVSHDLGLWISSVILV